MITADGLTARGRCVVLSQSCALRDGLNVYAIEFDIAL